MCRSKAMPLNQQRQGEFYIFLDAILWGLFPVITILSLQKLSPLKSLGWSTLFSVLFFIIIVLARGSWKSIANRPALKDILLTTILLGVLYYVFYFFGLRHTSAGNAAIIALTETFFSLLFFHVWRRDHIPPEHVLGAVLILIGAVIVLLPNLTVFRLGDLLILGAAFIAPFGNFFQQRARQQVRGETIMLTRALISTPVIFILAYIFDQGSSPVNLKSSLFLLIINGFFLFGLTKIFWIEGIHRISVTKTSALSCIAPLVTLLFAWLFLKDSPTLWQLFSILPMFIGVILLGSQIPERV